MCIFVSMEFGKVADPSLVDFTLPDDHPATRNILSAVLNPTPVQAYVGCAKWNKKDLKGFYPKGTKEELPYYSRQFNSIELNATFYGMPTAEQVLSWKEKTPDTFRFFPKITNTVTHFKRLLNVQESLELYCDAVSHFEEKLGMVFMQLHDNFGPKDFDRLQGVLEQFPKGIPLALEVRNALWFSDKVVFERYCSLLERLGITNIIVDTAGRRDMLHMRLTTPYAFIRYVGANHPSDIGRLDDWAQRLKIWQQQGLQHLYFFVHQNVEVESPLLATHFIKRINEELGLDLALPGRGSSLF